MEPYIRLLYGYFQDKNDGLHFFKSVIPFLSSFQDNNVQVFSSPLEGLFPAVEKDVDVISLYGAPHVVDLSPAIPGDIHLRSKGIEPCVGGDRPLRCLRSVCRNAHPFSLAFQGAIGIDGGPDAPIFFLPPRGFGPRVVGGHEHTLGFPYMGLLFGEKAAPIEKGQDHDGDE